MLDRDRAVVLLLLFRYFFRAFVLSTRAQLGETNEVDTSDPVTVARAIGALASNGRRMTDETHLEASGTSGQRDERSSPEEEDELHLGCAQVGRHFVNLGHLGRGKAETETEESERHGTRDLCFVFVERRKHAKFVAVREKRERESEERAQHSQAENKRKRLQLSLPPSPSLHLCVYHSNHRQSQHPSPLPSSSSDPHRIHTRTRHESRPPKEDEEEDFFETFFFGVDFFAGVLFLGVGLLLFFLAAGDFEREVRLRVERRVATMVFLFLSLI